MKEKEITSRKFMKEKEVINVSLVENPLLNHGT
jgi:hypothetical protein